MAKLSYKVSYYIMYICFALILVVLGMFYFVGYNNPVGEYNAPEHTETLIYLMYAMFGICEETEVKDGCTIAELSTFLALPEKGIAIAVNNRMVPRIEWEKCVLHPNDSLVVIKAACGG